MPETIIQPLPQRIPVTKAAKLLGRSPKTLYRWASEGRITHLKFGGRIEFTAEGIAQFVRDAERPAQPEATAA